MADLFSNEWINKLKDAWNAEPEVSGKLAEIKYSTTIGAGFQDEATPKVYFVVKEGKAVDAGVYSGQKVDWDMRAKEDTWKDWQKEGVGLTGLTAALATGKLKFLAGDYVAMLKNPSMAGPFGKCFNLMQKI